MTDEPSRHRVTWFTVDKQRTRARDGTGELTWVLEAGLYFASFELRLLIPRTVRKANMYENYKLCETLAPKEICLVVEQYKEGGFERKYHDHIPKHRLSEHNLQHLLQALVLKFENNEPRTIVRSHLNDRGKEPPPYKFIWEVTRPEPGVLRKCCGTDTHAWADQVIRTSAFRKQA